VKRLWVSLLAALAIAGLPRSAIAAPGDPLWSKSIAGTGSGADAADSAFDVEVSANGAMVFATGWVDMLGHGDDFMTVAFETSSGNKVWQRRYDGTGGLDQAVDIAVLGTRVFVVGTSNRGGAAGYDLITIAYERDTGQQLWLRRYNFMNSDDSAAAVHAIGGHVFVTGLSGFKMVTIALSPATGATQWTRRTNQAGESLDVIARGTRVYVLGRVFTPVHADAVLTAYRVDSGSTIWSRVWKSPSNGVDDVFREGALSADGSRIFAFGSAGTVGGRLLLTAYATGTGNRLWVRRPATQAGGFDYPTGIAASPSGPRVFICAQSGDVSAFQTFMTQAYSSSGVLLWTAREQGPDDHGFAEDITTNSEGTKVFTTGTGRNAPMAVPGVLSVAYDAADGAPPLWEHLTQSSTGFGNSGNANVVSPDGSTLIVAGGLDDIFTVEAYES
jgi:outer membrane protein assembly factor BamB